MRYTTQQGDSPSTIAQKFGLPLADLLAANPQKPTTVVSGVTTWQSLAVGEALTVPSGVGAAAAVAINALNADPNYCKSVGRPGSPVNVAIHNFKKAWNESNPGAPLPVGTGKYEITVAAALSTIVGRAVPNTVAPDACVPHQHKTYSEPMYGISDDPTQGLPGNTITGPGFNNQGTQSVPVSPTQGLPGNTITGPGFNATGTQSVPAPPPTQGLPGNTITGPGFNSEGTQNVPAPSTAPATPPPAPPAAPQGPSPAALVATGTLVSIAATAAGALSADPNYCKSVGHPGSPVNKAVHDFKKAWNAANPSNTVPVGTGKYEASVAAAIMSVLGGAGTAPDGCTGGGKHPAPPAPPVLPPAAPVTPPAPPTAPAPPAIARPAPPAPPAMPSVVSPAAQALAAVDPCNQANVTLVSAFQRSAGQDPDGKYGAKTAQALAAQVPGAPAGCNPRPAWWAHKGQRNRPETPRRPGAPHEHHPHHVPPPPAPGAPFVPPAVFVPPPPPPPPVVAQVVLPDDGGNDLPDAAPAAPAAASPPSPAPVAAATPPEPPPVVATTPPTDGGPPVDGKQNGKHHKEAGLVPPVSDGKGFSTGTLIAGGVGAVALVGIIVAAASGGGRSAPEATTKKGGKS